jgi:hypothetical protein
MAKAFERIRRFRWRDLVGIGQAAVVLCRVAFGIRWSSFPDLLDELRLRDEVPDADEACVDRAAQLVRWAHQLLPLAPNCLLDSLAAAALVRKRGFSVPLIIGVHRETGVLQAHAWLGHSTQERIREFQILYSSHEETPTDQQVRETRPRP